MFTPRELALERGWPGRIDGDWVVQLAAQTLEAFFSGGGKAREHNMYPLADVALCAPVLRPPSIRFFDDAQTFAFGEHRVDLRARGGSPGAGAGRVAVLPSQR